jgi:hypothetical protein
VGRAKCFPVPKFDFPDFDALTDSAPRRRLAMRKRPRESLAAPPKARAFRRLRERESELPYPPNDALTPLPVLIRPIPRKMVVSPPRK